MTPIRNDVSLSEGKQSFLDYVAIRYDEYVETFGKEPEGLIFCFANFAEVQASYVFSDDESDEACRYNSLLTARMLAVLAWEAREWHN